MQLYRKYIKEREGLELITRPYGFLSYAIRQEPQLHLFIADYFVEPESRRNGLAYKMADEAFKIAKNENVPIALCQCDRKAIGYEIARKSIENYGFKLVNDDGRICEFYREV